MANPIAGLQFALDASEAQVRFALIAGRFEDYGPALGGSVLNTLRKMEELQFDTEGDFSGKPWPALAPETIRGRVARGFGAGPILVREGRLRKSLVSRTSDSLVRVERFALTFGTRVEYADFHQHTQGDGKGIVPERQVIPDPLPGSVLDEIRANVRDYLVEGRIRSVAT